MGPWTYHNPVRVVFGVDSFERTGHYLQNRPYAVVTYGESPFTALTERLRQFAGAPCLTIDDVMPNPDLQGLGEICARLKRAQPTPQVLLALGGGSVMDTAKVLAASNGDFSGVRRYLVEGDGAESLGDLPIIAVPTTAGTGSEVTCWATVWDSKAGAKYSLSHPKLFPETAIIDPSLTLAMPGNLTVATALDALSHALESIWNRNANPVSTTYAVAAAREILAVLPKLVKDLGNIELRSRMAKAAVLAGLAFSNTKTALAHSLSYPITLRHGIAHGIACSFSLPLVLMGAISVNQDCDDALEAIFGADLKAAPKALSTFLRQVGAHADGESLGLSKETLHGLLMAALEGDRGRNYIGRRESVLAAVEGPRG